MMSTETITAEPDESPAAEEPLYHLVSSSTTLDAEEAATAAAEEEAARVAEDAKPSKPWFSGYCGPGPAPLCNDENHLDNVGQVIRHCLYVGENGAKAPKRFLYCACSCHKDPTRAGQASLSHA